ncbi:MAG: hypothetical protein ACJAWS_002382, partial [Oleiphilaceae bacterium]
PVIDETKEPLADAEEWADMPDKRSALILS